MRGLTSEQTWAAYMLLARGKVPVGTPTVEAHDPLCICQKPQIVTVDGMQYNVFLCHPAEDGGDWMAEGGGAQGHHCTPELAIQAWREELMTMDPADRESAVPVHRGAAL